MYYLVMAYGHRFGNLSGYHFPVGVFATLEDAQDKANIHREIRGGKYDHRIYEIKLGEDYYDAEEAYVVDGTGVFDPVPIC